MSILGFLDRDRTIAPPGFNRWLIPPAALAVHLCIGEIYGFSVFNVPLTRVVGISRSLEGQDWTIPQVGWIYSIALIMLGLSAALFGRWVERVGPRKTIVFSACCFCGGLVIASLGVSLHNIWVVYLGYGVIGGIGLGLGYIAPVSTLVKWFPDRPGMATGMAIMGFGGGALIGCTAGRRADGPVQVVDVGGGEGGVPGDGLRLLRLHDVRRVPRPRAGARLAARGVHAPVAAEEAGHPRRCRRGRRLEDAAVLAPLGGALPERHGRDRHPRPGVADVPGHVRRRPRRSAAGSPACSASSTWADASSGPRRPI